MGTLKHLCFCPVDLVCSGLDCKKYLKIDERIATELQILLEATRNREWASRFMTDRQPPRKKSSWIPPSHRLIKCKHVHSISVCREEDPKCTKIKKDDFLVPKGASEYSNTWGSFKIQEITLAKKKQAWLPSQRSWEFGLGIGPPTVHQRGHYLVST